MAIRELLVDLKAAYAKAGLDCADGLLPPLGDEVIDQIGRQLGLSIPNELRELWQIHGGQGPTGDVNTGLFGRHFMHTPQLVVGQHEMYMTHCLRDPLPEFPPQPTDWGYWNPGLIPFASWDAYDLCIHSQRGDVWEFCPNIGLRTYRPSIAAVLRELIEVVSAGEEPELRRKGTDGNLRGMEPFKRP